MLEELESKIGECKEMLRTMSSKGWGLILNRLKEIKSNEITRISQAKEVNDIIRIQGGLRVLDMAIEIQKDVETELEQLAVDAVEEKKKQTLKEVR